jgi:hypothetical protein
LRPLDYLESKDARLGSLGGAKSRQAQLPRHKLYPAPAAEAGFTIFVYNKSTTSTSRKISQITHPFSTPSKILRAYPNNRLVMRPSGIFSFFFA